MPAELLPEWLDVAAIGGALASEGPDSQELQRILDKSLSLTPLTLQEVASLMKAKSPEHIALIQKTALRVKELVYGDRIVLSAPLHISNFCESECLYCAFRHSNTAVERRRLSTAEIVQATTKLIRQGHKRILLVAGESWPKDGLSYVLEAARTIYNVHEGSAEIRRININLPPLTTEEYSELQEAQIGTCLLYQDTYHLDSYQKAHVKGPKSNYARRIHALDVALAAGVSDIGMGLMLGLGPWEFDVLALTLHAAHCARMYDHSIRTVSLHRMRQSPGRLMEPLYPLSDADYLRCVAILRLAIPHAGIILTTREPSQLWRSGCDAGGSQLLTGSVANPYESWVLSPTEGAVPFPIGEDCHVDEVVRYLCEHGVHMPSFCTACPRLGRSGAEFVDMVCSGGMESQCGPNSIASFEEYLLEYATPYTRAQGEALIDDRVRKMDEHARCNSEKLLQKVKSGRRDEFI
ncbi:MAG: [FeFe] hydrogenase H-cluster radical SAM maturase HydG [Desulfovibrionaceae bacterium]